MKHLKKVLSVSTILLCCAFATFAQVSQDVAPLDRAVLSLNLDKALELALAQNPTIKVADKDIELKKVADTEAWQNLLPSAKLDLTLNHSIKVAEVNIGGQSVKMGVDGATAATGGATINVPLFAPTVYRAMKLSKEDILAAQEAARGSRLDLVNQVTKAYYSALMAKDSRDVLEKSVINAEVVYKDISQKFEVGRVSEYDKISAEVQLRTMRSTLVGAESGLTLAILKLKVLMGITAPVVIEIDESLKDYDDAVDLAHTIVNRNDLSNNSKLRQLTHKMNLSDLEYKRLKTNFMPTISMQLTGQYQSIANRNWNVFKYHYAPSSTLMFNISVPIYNASNWTKLRTNRLQREQLSYTQTDTWRNLYMAAEGYRSNMLNSVAKLESDAKAVEQANKALTISKERYDVGRGTILELNQSEISLVQAELTYHQSIYDYMVNKADLDFTLGRGY